VAVTLKNGAEREEILILKEEKKRLEFLIHQLLPEGVMDHVFFAEAGESCSN